MGENNSKNSAAAKGKQEQSALTQQAEGGFQPHNIKKEALGPNSRR